MAAAALLLTWILAVFIHRFPEANAQEEGVSHCAAAFTGTECETPVNLPCFGRAFEHPLTLTNAYRGSNPNLLPDKLPGVLSLGKMADTSPEAAAAMFPPHAVWGQTHKPTTPFATCAVVGSSPSLTRGNSTYGEEIDAHPLVLRFNNAPTKGYEQFVGSKTNLRWENTRWSGFREDSTEALISWYCKPFRTFDAPLNSKTFRYDCRNPKQKWPELLATMLQKKIHPLNPAFDEWLAIPFREHGASPSSGLRGFAVLLHVCEHVHVYGMGGSQHWSDWYWDKYPGFEGKPPKGSLEKSFPRLADQKWEVETWNTVGDAGQQSAQANHESRFKAGPLQRSNSHERKLRFLNNGTRHKLVETNDNDTIDNEPQHSIPVLQTSHAQLISLHNPSSTHRAGEHRQQGTLEPKPALKRGVEDTCLDELQEAGMITVHH